MTLEETRIEFEALDSIKSVSVMRLRLLDMPRDKAAALIGYAYGLGRIQPWEWLMRECVTHIRCCPYGHPVDGDCLEGSCGYR